MTETHAAVESRVRRIQSRKCLTGYQQRVHLALYGVCGSVERSALNSRRGVSLSLPHACTGYRESARSVLEARILCEGGLWIWWRSHATVRLRQRHRFLYLWPRIAGIDRSFASRPSSVSCTPILAPSLAGERHIVRR
jgi:hypothetical protein